VTLFDESPRTVAPASASSKTVRVRMLVAYDGSGFHGFAINRDVPTVGGTLQQAIEMVVQSPVTLTVAGRTDRGVHAWGQVVSFDMPIGVVELDDLRHAVNKICGGRVVVRDAVVTDDDFDARFSARARVYRYTVVNQPVPDPFTATTAWWVDRPLDLAAMRLACDPLIGEHDFGSFCRRPKADGVQAPLMRRVIDARWSAPPDDRVRRLCFEIEATAFCHQMVRSIVGTIVEVGAGKKRAGEMAAILRARDRSAAGQMAPPHGLCLWEVRY
jgi:tRNA pseudouridine38-40 synthase